MRRLLEMFAALMKKFRLKYQIHGNGAEVMPVSLE